MVADRATHTFSPQRRSRCRWGSIVVPEPRLLLFPALALSLPARIIPQPTHRPPPPHCLRSAACRRRSPRSPRQVLQRARRSLARRWIRGALRCCWHARHHRPNDPWLVRTRAFSRGARSVTPRAQRAARLHTLVLSRLAAPRSGVRVGRAALPRAFTVTSQCARSPHMTRTGDHPPPLPRRPAHIPTRAPRAPSAQTRRTLTAAAAARRMLVPSGGGGRGAVRSDSLIFVLDAGRFRRALRGLHTREHCSRSVPRGRV